MYFRFRISVGIGDRVRLGFFSVHLGLGRGFRLGPGTRLDPFLITFLPVHFVVIKCRLILEFKRKIQDSEACKSSFWLKYGKPP